MHAFVDVAVQSETEVVHLDVILFGERDGFIEFSHFGSRFKVHRDDVVCAGPATKAIPNFHFVGEPRSLLVRRSANIEVFGTYKAGDLLSNLPFPIARPSLIDQSGVPCTASEIEAELRWLREQGIEVVDEETMATYTRTDSKQSTESRSGGKIDDQSSDSMKNDDATKTD